MMRGSRGDRARDADALALAAGERIGEARGGVARQAHEVEQLVHARGDGGASQPSSLGVIAMFSATVRCGNRPTSWNT